MAEILSYNAPPHLDAKALIERAARLLGEWQRKYGEHQPDWLPPAGEVRWLEDAAAYIDAHTLPAPTVDWTLRMDGTRETDRPCAVCGTPCDKHGSFPTCATHPYTPDANCRHVMGAACVGGECKTWCVRARGVTLVDGECFSRQVLMDDESNANDLSATSGGTR